MFISPAFAMIQVLKDFFLLQRNTQATFTDSKLAKFREQGSSISLHADKDESMDSRACIPCIKERFEMLNLAPATSSGSLEGGFAIVNLSSYKK